MIPNYNTKMSRKELRELKITKNLPVTNSSKSSHHDKRAEDIPDVLVDEELKAEPLLL